MDPTYFNTQLSQREVFEKGGYIGEGCGVVIMYI